MLLEQQANANRVMAEQHANANRTMAEQQANANRVMEERQANMLEQQAQTFRLLEALFASQGPRAPHVRSVPERNPTPDYAREERNFDRSSRDEHYYSHTSPAPHLLVRDHRPLKPEEIATFNPNSGDDIECLRSTATDWYMNLSETEHAQLRVSTDAWICLLRDRFGMSVTEAHSALTNLRYDITTDYHAYHERKIRLARIAGVHAPEQIAQYIFADLPFEMRNVLASSLEDKEAGDLNVFRRRCLAQRATLLMRRSEQRQMLAPAFKQPVQAPRPHPNVGPRPMAKPLACFKSAVAAHHVDTTEYVNEDYEVREYRYLEANHAGHPGDLSDVDDVPDAASLPRTFQLAPTYLRISVKPADGDQFLACLDTGSSVSLIDQATLKLFKHNLAPSDLLIRTASTPTRATGYATFALHVPCLEHAVARVTSCGLRTKALSRVPKAEPAGNPIIAHVSAPPPLDIMAPDMRAPPEMDGYHLLFTVIPDHPHSEDLPVFDDDVPAAFKDRFLQIFSSFPAVWRPKLGLLRSGEAMGLPFVALDANPHMFKPRLYRVSPRDRKAIDVVFDELTRQGRLTTAPPGTPCGWPVFVVYCDGKPRPVVDLRQLNDMVDPDAYPLPTPDELREPAGLSDVAFVYVDDFGVRSDTLDEHEKHIRATLNVIHSLGLTLAQEKAHVARKEVPLLRHLVSGLGTHTMPSKCEAIQSIPYPSTLNQLEHVVGFFSYYKNYVPRFSALIAPLQHLKTTLLRPSPKTGQARKRYCAGTSVPEDSSAKQSLHELKAILQGRALQFPDYSQPFLLYVDASQQHGFALALHQNRRKTDTDTATRCIDAIHPDSVDGTAEVPIWFDSRTLKPAERSYWATELEAAAAVWALFQVKRFLDASQGPHLLFTDHLAVTSIADAKPFSTAPAARNPRLVRFALILAEFRPKLWILHRKGIYMAHVDALSRIQAAETASASFHAQELIVNPGLVADILHLNGPTQRSSGYTTKSMPAQTEVDPSTTVPSASMPTTSYASSIRMVSGGFVSGLRHCPGTPSSDTYSVRPRTGVNDLFLK
ncbi:uncharacterized protein UDID_17636 [Ustilago sp. UG-2017a]|nr:uncharacterized protein UDID_17636 [Ustilago sp. UG-2017a]